MDIDKQEWFDLCRVSKPSLSEEQLEKWWYEFIEQKRKREFN